MHVEKACTHVCKVPVCVCLWASRASSEENVAPHWSHTSASAGAVDKIKFKRVCFDQTWTQTCVCNCSLSQLISHLKRTVEKSNERGGQRDAVWKVSKEPCLSHTCAFQVLTQGSKCAEYNGAVESAVKTQLGTNKSTRQGAMVLLLEKRKRKKKSRAEEFYLPCPVISLWTVSRLYAWEATEGLGVLSTADASRLRHIPLSKKTLQSQHPESHCIHCNYSSQFTFGMPLSVLMKTWERQVCTLPAETFNPCSALTSHLHRQTNKTDMHIRIRTRAHARSFSFSHTQLFGCGLALTEM